MWLKTWPPHTEGTEHTLFQQNSEYLAIIQTSFDSEYDHSISIIEESEDRVPVHQEFQVNIRLLFSSIMH